MQHIFHVIIKILLFKASYAEERSQCLPSAIAQNGPHRPVGTKAVEEFQFVMMDRLFREPLPGISLVALWLRIRLPVQGTWVRALVREYPTCRGATKPMSHNY